MRFSAPIALSIPLVFGLVNCDQQPRGAAGAESRLCPANFRQFQRAQALLQTTMSGGSLYAAAKVGLPPTEESRHAVARAEANLARARKELEGCMARSADANSDY